MKSLKIIQSTNLHILLAILFCNISWGQITGTINGVAITANHVVCPYTDYTIVLNGGVGRYFIEVGTTDLTVEKNIAGTYTTLDGYGHPGPAPATIVVRFTGLGTRNIIVTEGNATNDAKLPNGSGSCVAPGTIATACVATFSFNVQPLAHPTFGSPTVSGCTGNSLTLNGSAPATINCAGTACASLATYTWKQDGTTVVNNALTSPYTIPQGVIDAIMPAVTGQIVYTLITTVDHGPGIITCYDEAYVTVTRNDPPVLGLISLSPTPMIPPLGICANGTNELNITCTSGCDAAATYTWQYKTTGVYADVPANVSSNATSGAGPSYSNTITLDGTPTLLTPGLYDIQVIVENSVTKCATTSAEATNSVSINDLPGVEILHNYGAADWTGATTSDNAVTICTGKQLQLQPRGCDATNYSDDYIINQSSISAASLLKMCMG